MTEHITIKKMRNKAIAKKLKEWHRNECINRQVGEVIFVPVNQYAKYIHPTYDGDVFLNVE